MSDDTGIYFNSNQSILYKILIYKDFYKSIFKAILESFFGWLRIILMF